MRKIYTALVLLFCVAAMNSQTRFGIKVGGNYSTLTGRATFEASPKAGFHAGAFAEFKATEKFAVAIELLYSEQGTKIKDYQWETLISDGVFTYYNEKWTLSYINVPVMAKYHFLKKWYAEVGPQFSFLATANTDYENQRINIVGVGGINNELGTEDIKDNFKSFDFALNAGFGFDITDNFFINARYSQGFINVYDFAGATAAGFKAANSVSSVSLGYQF